MSAVFEKSPLTHRLAPILQGFDGPLAFAVFLLACAGLLTKRSRLPTNAVAHVT